MRLKAILVLLVTFGGMSCGSSGQEDPRGPEETAAPQQEARALPTTVNVSRADLIFRYWDESTAGFETETKWDAIPKASLRLIIVRDPKTRHPGTFLIVDRATCTRSTPCPLVQMTGRQLERAIAKQRGVAPPSDGRRAVTSQKPTLNFFTASWCSACTKARAYLKKNRIAHREYDIEKDSAARARLMQIGQGKGMGPEQLNSVPMFTYGNEIMAGFSPQKLKQFMR